MNNTLIRFAREELKKGLNQCTEKQISLFKKMYSYSDMTIPINELIDKMPDGKLDWAMQQVERTLANKRIKRCNSE